MKKLKITDKKIMNTVDSISNICACSAYQCSHGCNSDDNVYSATTEYYQASKRYSSRGIGPA